MGPWASEHPSPAHVPGRCELLEELGDGTHAVELDIASATGWPRVRDEVLERFGTIDILVNNVGVSHLAPFVETTIEDYTRLIGVNPMGVFLGMQAVLPTMVGAGSGAIINISSVDGIGGFPGAAAYGAAKHAVVGLSRTAALKDAASGLRLSGRREDPDDGGPGDRRVPAGHATRCSKVGQSPP